MKLWTVVHTFENCDDYALVYSSNSFSSYEKAYEFMKKLFEQTKELYLEDFDKDERFQVDYTLLDMGAEVFVGHEKYMKNDGYYMVDVFEIFEDELDSGVVVD